MTPNDISTPKKAESAPRQALELLADWLEARRTRRGCLSWAKTADDYAALEDLIRIETEAEAALVGLDSTALRAQAEAGTAWTAEELEELRGLAWVFGPENNGQFALTHGRAPDDTLSLAQMLDPDPRIGRRFPELQALIQFTTRELLLIHRGLSAALAQAGGESQRPPSSMLRGRS